MNDPTPEKSARGDLRARNAAGARALDQRREPRRGEDLQQGHGRRSRASSFPGFDWAAWTTELGVSGVPAVVVNQPSYLKALAATVNDLPVERGSRT